MDAGMRDHQINISFEMIAEFSASVVACEYTDRGIICDAIEANQIK